MTQLAVPARVCTSTALMWPATRTRIRRPILSRWACCPRRRRTMRFKLLGKDYDAMVATANTIDTEKDHADGNAVTAVSMAVRGVACNTKSILMFDDKGHLWAAIWEPASDSSSNVVELRYYTNVPKDKDSLPKTIAENREACSGDTVRVRMMP